MPRQRRKSQAEEALDYAAARMEEQIKTFKAQRDHLTAKIDALRDQREEILIEAVRLGSERPARRAKKEPSNAR